MTLTHLRLTRLQWLFVGGSLADLLTTFVGVVFGHGREAMVLSPFGIGLILVLACVCKLFVLWWAAIWARWHPAFASVMTVAVVLTACVYWVVSVNNLRTI